MSTRRPHTKSRRGCKRCKGRRMKCDELQPTCKSCLKSGVECDYGLLTTVSPSRLLETLVLHLSDMMDIPHNYQALAPLQSLEEGLATDLLPRNCIIYLIKQVNYPAIPSPMSIPSECRIELKLLHHYIDMTARGALVNTVNQETKQNVRNIWSDWTIRLAIDTPHLMDALLAIAAFHLRHLNVAEKHLTEIAHQYMLRAITEHSKQIRSGITAKNGEAVFATSTFIAFHATSGEFNLGNGNRRTLMHWFQPWGSIRALVSACWPHIKSEKIKNVIRYEQALEHASQTEDPEPKYNFLIDDLDPESVDSETLEAYQTAIYYLNKFGSKPFARHVLQYTSLVPKRFVDLVQQSDPRALTIVGYHLTLVKSLEQVWYLMGSAERDWKVLMVLLPEEWKPKMELAAITFEKKTDAVVFEKL